MDMGDAEQWSSLSSPSSHPKRPAGRTKFKETRHPVYRGVRRRLWLSTYFTAESTARAHDATMLALGGPSVVCVCLNFADSSWLLTVPAALADVRRAALPAVADFHRRQAATVPVDEADTCSVSAPSSADNGGSSATSPPIADEVINDEVAAGHVRLRGSSWTCPAIWTWLGSYYADLAEGMVLEPPAPEFTEAHWDASLWSN